RAETVLLDFAARRSRFVDQAAHFGAVRESRRRAVVARGKNVLVANDDRADLRSVARRTVCDLPRDQHEVLIPRRSLAHRLLRVARTPLSFSRRTIAPRESALPGSDRLRPRASESAPE